MGAEDDIIDTRFLRLLDTEVELDGLDELIALLDRQLTLWKDTDSLHAWIEARLPVEQDYSSFEVYLDRAHVTLPRTFGSAVVVLLWATFESGVRETAKALAQHGGIRKKIDKIKADGFVLKSIEYFGSVLRMPLAIDKNQEEALMRLARVRNAIAHANGRVEAVKSITPEMLSDLERHGVSTFQGYIFPSLDFVRQSLHAVRVTLAPIIARVRALP